MTAKFVFGIDYGVCCKYFCCGFYKVNTNTTQSDAFFYPAVKVELTH